MMNSSQIFDALEQIAAHPSKNDKQALVAKYGQDGLFHRVMCLAYNPLITFGIATRPSPVTLEGTRYTPKGEFDYATLDMLHQLQTRRLTGAVAEDTVAFEMAMLNEKSANLLWRIIKKDLRAGFGESTINKAFKGSIPEFPYMRCSLPKDADFESWDWASGAISQEKADGMFANVDHEKSGIVRITSRQGTEYDVSKFPEIVNEVRTRLPKGMQYHGEFLVQRDGEVLERALSNGIMNSIANDGDFADNERPVYLVWDAIPLSEVVPKGKYNKVYKLRVAGIANALKATSGSAISLIPTRVVRSLQEAYAHAGELMKQGKEGTIVKNPNAIWKDGTSKEQIKLKLEFEVDLVVKAIMPGEVDTKNEGRAGALACETSDGLLKVNVTVKNEDMRDRVDANHDDWVGRIIVVKANDILLPSESNEHHSLFLPRMIEPNYRLDKTVADDLPRVFAAKELAILGESLKKAA